MGLPALHPFPDEIEELLPPLLQNPGDPALEAWLYELIQSSGHLSTNDDLRWRTFCIVWLAAEFDVDKAWPYLRWLNAGEPALSAHLSEILIDGIDQLGAHVQMANWLAELKDQRLLTFFKDFQVIPTQRRLKPLMSGLMLHPAHPKIGVWLAAFCKGTEHNDGDYLRGWRLLAAAWYATAFNPREGSKYLRVFSGEARTLSPADTKLLMDTAEEVNGAAILTQMMAACPDMVVKTLLKDFGQPDLAVIVESIYQRDPDYRPLAQAIEEVPDQVEIFKHIVAYLEHEGVSPKKARLLDLACGLLATQAVLLNSVGYKTEGVDRDIPPAYLPLAGLKSWFKRRRYVRAWKEATKDYYQALAEHLDLKLKWGQVKIRLANLTRLGVDNNSYEAVVCMNYLHHASDIKALLAEISRVLKPGGLLLADIRPFAGLRGVPEPDPKLPWGHLRSNKLTPTSARAFNRWREADYRQAMEACFSLEEWLPETDPEAQFKLTPEIQAELADYGEEELTRKQIIVVARKR